MNKSLAAPAGLKHLFTFALPTLLSNVFMGLYGVVDGYFASNYISVDALSCVNICMPIVMLTLLLGIMLGCGGNALVARKLGEGKDREAKEDFTLITLFGTGFSAVICALAFLFRVPLLRFLGAGEVLIGGCLEYAVPLLILIPFNIPGTILEMSVITVEKPGIGFIASTVGGATNIFLDWLLIVKLDMGLSGAAIATCIGYIVPAMIGVAYFTFNRKLSLYFVRPKWRGKTIADSCTNGSSEMVGLLATSIITILMNNILMDMKGPDGVAAVSVVLYAESVFSSAARGYSIGVSPVISYKYGQRNTPEIVKTLRVGLISEILIAFVSTVVCYAGAGELVKIFVSADKSQVVNEMAVEGFRIFAFSIILSAVNIYASAFYTALNDGLSSAVLAFTRAFIFMALPLLILPKIFGMYGIWWTFAVSEALAAAVSVFYLLKVKDESWIYRSNRQTSVLRFTF